ncbi:MAG: transcription termination factor Rho [Lachnospiraceae bacterium]|nr:transcription termination factor Rho [Lachnospiraceae bacterium]MBQ9934852.1 transcription termination factor Rho [Lachnospiraceae bacterium]
MDFKKMTIAELRQYAKDKGIVGVSAMKKPELADLLEKVELMTASKVAAQQPQETVETKIETKEEVVTQSVKEAEAKTSNLAVYDGQEYDPAQDSGQMAYGILEVMEGYGFIRSDNYLPGDKDIYVGAQLIKKFNMKKGDILEGPVKVNDGSKFSALLYVKSINGMLPTEAAKRTPFEQLTPIFPDERIKLDQPGAPVSIRIVDLLSPIGKGQRGMIVSPPKAGKTTLLKSIAKSISTQNRDMHLIVLLIDERPEEVTDIRESIEGPNVEVIYSTFDELPEHHKRVSEMVMERAKRLVEHKKDVVILLDSITRLARAYNLTVPPSGRTLSGGLDPAALHMPKKFFGAARNMREGGSLTILATALVETGSRMDDVVFEEFKGTGNMELVLDRKLSEKRIFPAIDISKSGTRRDDLLLDLDEQEVVNGMHKAFAGLRAEEAIEDVLKLFVRTKDNKEFVNTAKKMFVKK